MMFKAGDPAWKTMCAHLYRAYQDIAEDFLSEELEVPAMLDLMLDKSLMRLYDAAYRHGYAAAQGEAHEPHV